MSSEVRSSRLPRPLSSLCITSFLHCAKSLRTVSRADTFRSLPRLGSASVVLLLSRVRTLESPVELFSLLMAAASRSGHSERLTNSYWASGTSSTLCDGPDLCLPADSGLEDSRRVKASAGGPAVSLNSCRVAATLRPMPAFTWVPGDTLLS